MMLDQGECERVRRLLMEAIGALCRNSLHYKSEFSVEGLLGITLDGQDIFLVNIKETGASSIHGETRESTSKKPPPEEEVHQRDSSEDTRSSIASDIISKPLTPMGGFRAAGRKRRHPVASSSAYYPETEHRLEKKAFFALSPYRVEPRDSCDSAGVGGLHARLFADIKAEPESDQCITCTKESPAEQQPWMSTEEGAMSLATRETQSGCRSGVTASRSLGQSLSQSLSQSLQTNFNVSLASSSLSDLTYSSLRDVPQQLLSPQMKFKVRRAVLKEDGCFVTSRMLCRRYSNLFKAHNVVDAMQQLSTALDDPEFIGEFRRINDRTKVFYKAPPSLIQDTALAGTKLTKEMYAEIYQRMPRSKGSKSTNWYGFVGQVLDQSPYGRMAMDSLVEGEGEDPSPEEYTPKDTMDEFSLQQAIIYTEGCFVSTRILCRKVSKGYKVSNVLRAMQAMTRTTGDKHYVGEFCKISDRVKLFYKCPPAMISQEALTLYNITMETYHALYYMNPRPADSSISNWDAYIEAAVDKFPYGSSNFPFKTCGASSQVCFDLKLAMERESFTPKASAATGGDQGMGNTKVEKWSDVAEPGQSGLSEDGPLAADKPGSDTRDHGTQGRTGPVHINGNI